jgi:hypothetical protein
MLSKTLDILMLKSSRDCSADEGDEKEKDEKERRAGEIILPSTNDLEKAS